MGSKGAKINMKEKLNKDKLKKVTGGEVEPEEFSWSPNGYLTPEKPDNLKPGEHKYESIGDNKK